MIDRCEFVHDLPCEQVSDRITALETENENLLKTVDSVMPSLIEDNARLKVENAKLREFAEMFAKVADEVGCDHCPYCDPDLCDDETDPMKDGCRLYEELRELGVTDD